MLARLAPARLLVRDLRRGDEPRFVITGDTPQPVDMPGIVEADLRDVAPAPEHA